MKATTRFYLLEDLENLENILKETEKRIHRFEVAIKEDQKHKKILEDEIGEIKEDLKKI